MFKLRDCTNITINYFTAFNISGNYTLIDVENVNLYLTNLSFKNITTTSPYIIEIVNSQKIYLTNLKVSEFYPRFLKFSYSSLILNNGSFSHFQFLGTLHTLTIMAEYVVTFSIKNCLFTSLKSTYTGAVF